jgi:hypothetical protein
MRGEHGGDSTFIDDVIGTRNRKGQGSGQQPGSSRHQVAVCDAPGSMPRSEPTPRSKTTRVVALTVGIGVWYLAVLPFLFARWSPPVCGNPCAGPSSQPATLIVVGAIVPLILLFALTASSRRVVALGVGTAVASAVAYAIALSFESSVCPNFYANDCHGRGVVALLYWGAYIGPVLVASFALGAIRGRSWTPFLALPLAGLIGALS